MSAKPLDSAKDGILDDSQFEDVIFTFMKRVNDQEAKEDAQIRKRLVDFLAGLGETRAKNLIRLWNADENLEVESPTVGIALRQAMEVAESNGQRVAKNLGISTQAMGQLLNEGFRITPSNLDEVSKTISIQFRISNLVAFQEMLRKGLRYLELSKSNHSVVKMAARKKQ